MIVLESDFREKKLNYWAQQCLRYRGIAVSDKRKLKIISSDASFRRYFRMESIPSYIFVDAPPYKEDCKKFVDIATLIASTGLNAPKIFASDFKLGFLMISDLGDTVYLDRINLGDNEEIDKLYGDALTALLRLQQIKCDLPHFGQNKLLEEMHLFVDWFLEQELQISNYEESGFEEVLELMLVNAAEQPQSFVHRDFHCRNLMVATENNPGIIDFQDAVIGPVTYDLVSLLKDCYHSFTFDQVAGWVEMYRERLISIGCLDKNVSREKFLRWFELMGFQRHLKCVGIFSRLHLRDSKAQYLKDIPLVIGYMMELQERYHELRKFCGWIEQKIIPELNSHRFVRP
ncbi:MAG: aminoglycoside phosphotransferase family protein [Candidatus Azotimanducaceae bacterium]|nr:aminoglycoside phosphotransferase [Gammaproteobacteria bacterium]